MKIFLSWSGATSHKVACIMRDWLPSVIQAVRPYVSSEDIDKGARWSTDIAAELEQARYGVICITRNNIEAPWLNFEAGALSRVIDKANVTPFLFRIKRSEVRGPLLQFQSVLYDEADLLKLLKSINQRLNDEEQLSEEQLQRSFKVWWPQLRDAFEEVPKEEVDKSKESPTDASSEIMEELLELVRSQHRLLSSPREILPPSYLLSLLRRERRHTQRLGIRPDIHENLMELILRLESLPETEEKTRLQALGERLHALYHEDDEYGDVLPANSPEQRLLESTRAAFRELSERGENRGRRKKL